MSQHMEHLAKANEIREVRARFKREIKDDPTLAERTLREPIPYWLDTFAVKSFLCAIPGVGPHRLREILPLIPISPDRKLGHLSPREKAALILRLRQKAYLKVAA